MVRVNVKLFATLRSNSPDYNPDKGIDMEVNDGGTVEDLLQALHLPQNESKVIIVNGVLKRITDLINDRDQVNIFILLSGG